MKIVGISYKIILNKVSKRNVKKKTSIQNREWYINTRIKKGNKNLKDVKDKTIETKNTE